MKIVILATLAIALCSGCATANIQHGIPNFRMVEPGVYRGGQPTKAGFDYLKSIGVTNIIKLNILPSDRYAAKIGITVHRFPINIIDQILIGPRDQITLADYCIVPGTYIHCSHGQDRTGLLVGYHRRTGEGWTKEAAYKEMRTDGFHPILFGLTRYWKSSVP